MNHCALTLMALKSRFSPKKVSNSTKGMFYSAFKNKLDFFPK